MNERNLGELIQDRVVIFDGAMGTELYQRHQFINVCFEELCLTKPQLVQEVHAHYREVEADVITTNSFGGNRIKLAPHLLDNKVKEINRASAKIAREVAQDKLFVAGSVGPTGQLVGTKDLSEDEAYSVFYEQIEGLKEGGADLVILETFSKSKELFSAIKAASALEMPYIPSIALGEIDFTTAAERAENFFLDYPKDIAQPVMFGFNCGVGPKQLLDQLERLLPKSPFPIVAQPNAGYPQQVSDRWIYMTSPEYLATYALHYVQLGVRAVGGCCGTSYEHIKALANSVKSIHKKHVVIVDELKKKAELVEPVPLEERSRFAKKLKDRKWVKTVEIVPPLGWDVQSFIEKAAKCHRHGVDAINIPDGPRASSRLSPIISALKIQNEAHIETILHLTCRDRNIIGMQSDLLGAAAAGINNLLIITGDPPKLGDYPFASAVFDIDSIGLSKIASRLNRGVDIGGQPVTPPTKFCIGVGTDPSHLDQAREINRLEQKVEAGAEYIITQPVFDPEKLLRFLEKIKHIHVPIIAGIWPLYSVKNAEFLNNEVPGVTVPQHIVERMAKKTSKEEARAEGVKIARELISAVRNHVSGIHVSSPFGYVKTALEVLND